MRWNDGLLALQDFETHEPLCENEAFLKEQLITYLGNKRSLLKFIGRGVRKAQSRLGKEKVDIFDVFSGSGIVARYCKQFADRLIVNDMEAYSALINRCYLSNQSEVNVFRLRKIYYDILDAVKEQPLRTGIIADLYAPKDDDHIGKDDRVFYTSRNARYIDTVRQIVETLYPDDRKYFLAPLLAEASVHANTSGVFKGFYKNKETGIGEFGGKNRDALPRIKGDIRLPFPVFSNFDAQVTVLNDDANRAIAIAPEADIAYIDPPYNQHPYGSNYFMLNLILDYKYPERASAVSGIPEDWKRSAYNKPHLAFKALSNLVSDIRAKYVLVSFNSEGFIALPDMKAMLERYGRLEILETRYNTFRGCRNLQNRDTHVKEYLYLLEKW
jgi:adenine-specific DNA-methyltransferase